MRIYTRTGDAGQTSLRWGERVPKDSLRVEAYGTVDEANGFIGLAIAYLPAGKADGLKSSLLRIQRELFDVGADLAVPPNREKGEQPKVQPAFVEALEAEIDAMDKELEPMRTFILPGGTKAAAALHVARTVVRRAERRLVTLMSAEPVDPVLLKYLNRLSDFLFQAARYANFLEGAEDVKVSWK
jgi:cob(I)alamin adenosyltransferase